MIKWKVWNTAAMVIALVTTVFMVGCGASGSDSDSASSTCGNIEGELHVASGESDPDAVAVMLHLVGQSCVMVGENNFHLVAGAMGGGDMEGMRVTAAQDDMDDMSTDDDTADAGDVDLTIEAVAADMPGMGHGTTEDPVISAAAGMFVVNFQMPGDWRVDVEFSEAVTAEAATAPVLQTVSFDVEVQ